MLISNIDNVNIINVKVDLNSMNFETYIQEEIEIPGPEIISSLQKIEKGFYYYAINEQGYSGTGFLLFLYKGQWRLYDCSHCSCYHSLKHFVLDSPLGDDEGDDEGDDYIVGIQPDLNNLYDSCTPDLQRQVKPLIDEAKKYGYK